MFWLVAITFSLVAVSCAPSRYVAQQDSDDDGVPDVWDKCDLASGTWDNCGCPEPIKIVTLAPTVSDVGAPLVRDLGIGGTDTQVVQETVDNLWLFLEGKLSVSELVLEGTEFDKWETDLNQKHKDIAKILGVVFDRFYNEKGSFPNIKIVSNANYTALSDAGSVPKNIRKIVSEYDSKGEKDITLRSYKWVSDMRAKKFCEEVKNYFSSSKISYTGISIFNPATEYDKNNKSGSNRLIYLKRIESVHLLGSNK